MQLAKQNRFSGSAELGNMLKQKTGVRISPGHVRKLLCNVNLKSRPAVKKPFLTNNHAKQRLIWCKTYKNWNFNNWKMVLFSDESTFQLYPNSHKRVRRLPSEKFLVSCVNPQRHSGGGKVTVWGGISWNGYTSLQIVTGSINAERYIDILNSKMLPFFKDEMPLRGAIFQHDNAGPHCAKRTLQWLENHNVKVLAWPACSPDLNLIENVWKMLGDKVSKRMPTTVEQLAQFLSEEWSNLPLEILHNLYNSMSRRINKCIAAKGFYFKS